MFIRVALFIVLVVGTSNGDEYIRRRNSHYTTPIEPDRRESPNVTELIRDVLYHVEEYQVVTSDGYILDLIRVPNGIKRSPYEQIEVPSQESDESSNEEFGNSARSNARRSKGAVLLMTGYMSNAEDFVIDSAYQALVFILADFGFDVYLGNVRGGRYGLKHTTLDPNERDFWRFGIHEIGTRDVPAIVDKVLEVSGKSKLHYIGHMLGSTIFYVMASSKPEYNDKIQSMIDLGNLVYMKNAPNKVIKQVSEHLDNSRWINENLGEYKFNPSQELLSKSKEDCERIHYGNIKYLPMCRSKFFLVSGYNSEKIRSTNMLGLALRSQYSTSTKQVLDLAYMKKTGVFGRCIIPVGSSVECTMFEYNLKRVTAPVYVFYTLTDSLCPFSGVRKLLENLPSVKDAVAVGYENSLDLLHGNHVDFVMIPKIIRILLKNRS